MSAVEVREDIKTKQKKENGNAPELDVRAADSLHFGLTSSNQKSDFYSSLFMCVAATLTQLDPIFTWLAFFVALSLYINKKARKLNSVSMMPMMFLGFCILRYVLICSGKQPIPKMFKPILNK